MEPTLNNILQVEQSHRNFYIYLHLSSKRYRILEKLGVGPLNEMGGRKVHIIRTLLFRIGFTHFLKESGFYLGIGNVWKMLEIFNRGYYMYMA